jgi:hypothetical protein
MGAILSSMPNSIVEKNNYIHSFDHTCLPLFYLTNHHFWKKSKIICRWLDVKATDWHQEVNMVFNCFP